MSKRQVKVCASPGRVRRVHPRGVTCWLCVAAALETRCPRPTRVLLTARGLTWWHHHGR